MLFLDGRLRPKRPLGGEKRAEIRNLLFMSRYTAEIQWERGEQSFLDNRYSREHRWIFDGGAEIAASSSPSVVPLPYSSSSAVDPEEAFVASLSSCHMLWFLSLAARQGYRVDRYRDRAEGRMGRDAEGRTAMLRVVLRPRVSFSGAKKPSESEHAALHEEAHRECFIANSVRTEVVCESGLE